jgi:hypothetical protein
VREIRLFEFSAGRAVTCVTKHADKLCTVVELRCTLDAVYRAEVILHTIVSTFAFYSARSWFEFRPRNGLNLQKFVLFSSAAPYILGVGFITDLIELKSGSLG